VDRPWPSIIWPVPPDVELAGRVVRLTRLEPIADAPALFAALDHDRVWEHLTERPETVPQFAQQLLTRSALPSWHQWLVRANSAVADLAESAVIGTTSYLEVSRHDARLEIGSTAYTPATWGTAINPEVKLLLFGYAFDTLRAGRVQLKTDVRNVRSQQAIARLGARYEGTLRRYQRRADGSLRDTVLFSVTAEDWPDVRRRLQARLRT